MYHSVIFGEKHSFDDWHLIPDSRPVVALPEPKFTMVEVPGANGAIDLSESLVKYPVYQNRKGSLAFIVLNGYEDWTSIYSKIASYLHGKRLQMTLEDDPDWYYEGRFTFKEWVSNNDGTWSNVNIDYEVDPYKYSKTLSTYTLTLTGGNGVINLNVDDKLGSMPVVPTIKVTNVGGSGIAMVLTNAELGISGVSKSFASNRTYKEYEYVLSARNPNNVCQFAVSGTGTVEVSFRKGEL